MTITLPPLREGRPAPADLAERRGQMQAAVDAGAWKTRVPPVETASAPVMPITCVGFLTEASGSVMPEPVCPSPAAPQHMTAPVFRAAQACSYPAQMCTASVTVVMTGEGFAAGLPMPVPSSPFMFAPQQ